VMVIHLLVALAASQHHFFSVDDDDIVTAINMRREDGLVFAPVQIEYLRVLPRSPA
jgi:hypothetical protein